MKGFPALTTGLTALLAAAATFQGEVVWRGWHAGCGMVVGHMQGLFVSMFMFMFMFARTLLRSRINIEQGLRGFQARPTTST